MVKSTTLTQQPTFWSPFLPSGTVQSNAAQSSAAAYGKGDAGVQAVRDKMQEEKSAVIVSKSLLKLICAATVSSTFRHQLLTKPEQSLDSGYNGESFELEPEERALVLSVQAASLEDFSKLLIEKLGQGSHHQENAVYHDATHRVTSSGD